MLPSLEIPDSFSSHLSGERYRVEVESSRAASDIIITYGAPVMTMGRFSGSDPILTVDKIKGLINAEEIRYFLIGEEGVLVCRGEGMRVSVPGFQIVVRWLMIPG